MARQLTLPSRKNTNDRRTWHGMAFILEALILLVFLIASSAILLQVFSSSQAHSQKSDDLSYAVILASNEAERFSSDPESDTTRSYVVDEGVLKEVEVDSTAARVPGDVYVVTRSVTSQTQSSGTMYHAAIIVEHAGKLVYDLDSSRYVNDAEQEVRS